ncbi:AlbA family DNA-binding domain-containing protein [Fulvivirga lutea]|uniref:ATP-binding protein n=1 Tax=Fulvivirga lutea TaxID=2810512 RepID=A0A974WHJ3_9BACT|nr:ATP-binding protein [Fulvivirga lutea]QSE97357.1 ATP-binding protein [Fulvivirga lutea]
MTYRDLRKLVAQGESEFLEFKRKVAHPEKIVRELVAFANTNGGQLLIGVSDNGDIPGVKFPEDEIYALNKSIEELCKPAFEYNIEEIELSEKATAIVYHIPQSKRRPHAVKEDIQSKWGQVYVRHEDKSVKASREMREIIKRKRKNKDIRFNYGEKEQKLMAYLEEQKSITLEEFKELAGLNNYMASRTLVLLVLANVLAIRPTEKGDIYTLKNIS